MSSADPAVHEQLMRDMLRLASEMDLSQSPPVMAQLIHRRLRQMVGVEDPYRQAKERLNRIALELLPALRVEVQTANDPLSMAVRLAIAGNVIDMGIHGIVSEADVRQAIQHALEEPFLGEIVRFRQAVAEAQTILYLADNAGEIAFDRLLIEQLGPERVTLVVRGAPVINDVTLADAQAVELDEIVTIIDNGSDAPGTLLDDCSPEFRRFFAEADLILAKGQGNYESLSDNPAPIFFLFKVKCAVIAAHVGQPLGAQVLGFTLTEDMLFDSE